MSGIGVVFDLDGVIVDTAKYHYAGWKKLADQLGVDFDEERNEQLKGVSRRESLIKLLGYTPSEDNIRKWCTLKNGYYLEFISRIDHSELLPGALRLLQKIHLTAGCSTSLASASKNAKAILEKIGVTQYFDVIVDGTDVTRSKPDPEVFQIASQRLHLPPERLVVLEDAESGVQAAKAAGMTVIGVGHPSVLTEADLVVQNLAEVSLRTIDNLLKVSACC